MSCSPACELYPTSYQANYLMKQLRGSAPKRLRPLISRTLTRPLAPLSTGQLPKPDSLSKYFQNYDLWFILMGRLNLYYTQVLYFYFINDDSSIWKSFFASLPLKGNSLAVAGFLTSLSACLDVLQIIEMNWSVWIIWTVGSFSTPPNFDLCHLYGQGQRVVANRRSFQKLANIINT